MAHNGTRLKSELCVKEELCHFGPFQYHLSITGRLIMSNYQ